MIVGIREAKTNLSRLLKEVQKGAEITISDRGILVARLVPITEDSLSIEQRIENLERNGLLDPPPKNVRLLPPPLPVEEGIVQKYLQEDRD
ncbi:MAG: type II toxin-antitoxin system prevent-host-death family antitoxin [Syntrophomonas sp.]|uniref:type II toxin-antitoxin system Phd/YefM family antitoxin n=1 Tax=Syntrophomonas sp. TaxID=2053627 RepID=UPI002616740A|nr:type II toxin-antitoxin system prevent-host-death family antitoxin [Syntrophomonas sp.]MDD4627632.1 type II toxin-antitoxin system prevent-host-death family antitoxin [Syntrophomonas sp.]